VLPYVVSGRSAPERVALRTAPSFEQNKVGFIRGAAVTAVDACRATRRSSPSGEEIAYGKLLLATGASPPAADPRHEGRQVPRAAHARRRRRS
jgi:phenylglyoxylate dehydrogenase epsilon subunit